MAELPTGIYWRSGDTPPRHFAVLFLRPFPDKEAVEVGQTLEGLVGIWRGLEAGVLPDLPGVTVPVSGFTWLIGYGRNAFNLPGIAQRLPPRLDFRLGEPLPQGGGEVIAGSGLGYAPGVSKNPATEAISIQMFGDTPLAVNRGIVETWKHLDRTKDAALMLAAAYTGFNREDHRSWIDFHDGLSNLAAGDQRRRVVAVKSAGLGSDRWTRGGTYAAFMRIAVDLQLWNAITPQEQELIVGRTKGSGCPLLGATSGQGQAVAGCPTTPDITDAANLPFREPPHNPDAVVKLSHVQRANHHQGPIDNVASRRIFRQGYEFAEPPTLGRSLEVGLNFVSFQDHPDRLLFILKQDGWLGRTNFGGPSPDRPLLSVLAAGFFVCPPVVDGELYPGAHLFTPPPATVAASSRTRTGRDAARTGAKRKAVVAAKPSRSRNRA